VPLKNPRDIDATPLNCEILARPTWCCKTHYRGLWLRWMVGTCILVLTGAGLVLFDLVP
jgi:hypothetical protein